MTARGAEVAAVTKVVEKMDEAGAMTENVVVVVTGSGGRIVKVRCELFHDAVDPGRGLAAEG